MHVRAIAGLLLSLAACADGRGIVSLTVGARDGTLAGIRRLELVVRLPGGPSSAPARFVPDMPLTLSESQQETLALSFDASRRGDATAALTAYDAVDNGGVLASAETAISIQPGKTTTATILLPSGGSVSDLGADLSQPIGDLSVCVFDDPTTTFDNCVFAP